MVNGGVNTLDINGINLIVDPNINPAVVLGGVTPLTVLATADLGNQMSQIIVELPSVFTSGMYDVTVTNSMGTSSVFMVVTEVKASGANWAVATLEANWSARRWHTSLVYDNKMWVLGGSGGGTAKQDVWSSTDGITWTEVTPVSGMGQRNLSTSFVYDNKMWVLGNGGSKRSQNDVWSSTDGVNWTEVTAAAAWPARSYITSAVYDNKMWVMGGVGKNDVWHSVLP